MSEKSEALNDTLQALTDTGSFVAKGKMYIVKRMPLAYVDEYLQEPFPLVYSKDDSSIRDVMINFSKFPIKGKDGEETECDMLAVTEKWIPRLLKYEGKDCTLPLLKTHDWDLADFNNFLKKALSLSG